MKKLAQICDGNEKRLYATDNPAVALVEFKDTAVSQHGLKRGVIEGKGSVNNRVSNCLMQLLEKNGIPTHYLEEISDRETLVRRVDMMPLRITVRNVAAGHFAQRLGIPEGTPLTNPVIECRYKSAELGDPLINEEHAQALHLANKDLCDQIVRASLRINEVLRKYFRELDIELIDFRLRFGLNAEGRLILADELSPDTCRLWDSDIHERLDKDRFRRDMSGAAEAYQELNRRVLGE